VQTDYDAWGNRGGDSVSARPSHVVVRTGAVFSNGILSSAGGTSTAGLTLIFDDPSSGTMSRTRARTSRTTNSRRRIREADSIEPLTHPAGTGPYDCLRIRRQRTGIPAAGYVTGTANRRQPGPRPRCPGRPHHRQLVTEVSVTSPRRQEPHHRARASAPAGPGSIIWRTSGYTERYPTPSTRPCTHRSRIVPEQAATVLQIQWAG